MGGDPELGTKITQLVQALANQGHAAPKAVGQAEPTKAVGEPRPAPKPLGKPTPLE